MQSAPAREVPGLVEHLGYDGGINLYGYVANNAVNFSDVLGLDPDELVLPKDPSGLPSGWSHAPSHKDPNGERWKGPGGDYLDFHKGRPGLPGWRGKDHWHHNGKKDHYSPGDDIQIAPDSCPDPTTDPKRMRRTLQPGADELRMQEISNREMEIFWTKILVGSAIGGAVYLAGPASIPPALRLGLRWAWAY